MRGLALLVTRRTARQGEAVASHSKYNRDERVWQLHVDAWRNNRDLADFGCGVGDHLKSCLEMEPRHHGPRPLRPTSPAVPFVGWPHTNRCVVSGGPGRMLLREMLWQLEQRALQVQEEEFQYCISRGILGYRHPQAYPSLLALIPASEHRQLERLCGRIPPSHTAIVLSRLHDLLAHNDIPPWELVGVFKQVLKDFLRRQEDGMQKHPVPSVPTTENNDRNHIAGNASNSSSEESGKHREEIPTISSYVDKHLRAACPYSIHRDWSLPFCHPFAYEAYSTTL